jgi:2-deoxy-D-gluconate 3-dehydrogenase
MTDPVRAEQPSARDLFDLSGRAAVVTGGAGLLGVEFCRTLAQAGAEVLAADLNLAAAEALAESLRGEGLRAAAAGVDVTDPQSVEAMTAAALNTFGRLDILVNSAALDPKFDPQALQAGSQSADFEHYPLELWNQALAVNLTGVFLCCQSAARAMLDTPRSPQDSAAIVNLSSIYGITAPDQRLYQRPGQPPQYKPA